jgi:hypothetical protein
MKNVKKITQQKNKTINKKVVEKVVEKAVEKVVEKVVVCISNDEIYNLIKIIKKLSQREKIHILNILKKHNIEYTKNSNGYFFNLDKMNINIINKLIKCTELIEEKRDIIASLDEKREENLEYYKMLIDTKLQDTINFKKQNYTNTLLIKNKEYFEYFTKRTRLSSIKKIASDGDDIDIEILLRRKKKYIKGSVYYRLTQTMALLKKKQNAKPEKHESSGIEEESKNIEQDITDQIEEIEELEISEQLEELELEELEIEDQEDQEDQEIEEDPEDIEENDIDDLDEIDEELTIANKEFDYYKNLLKQNGFNFDEDKLVIMQREQYLI